jgi:hypothetical protein
MNPLDGPDQRGDAETQSKQPPNTPFKKWPNYCQVASFSKNLLQILVCWFTKKREQQAWMQ